MKISLRILLINFIIVVLIVGISSLAFYSIMQNILTSQQTQYLSKSGNNFVHTYRVFLQKVENDFISFYEEGIPKQLNNLSLKQSDIDFIFEADDSEKIQSYAAKDFIYLNGKQLTKNDFFTNNPYAVYKKQQIADGRTFYFGKIINSSVAEDFSQRINSDVAVIWSGSPVVVSNEAATKNLFYLLTQTYKNLKEQDKFEVISESDKSSDIIAALYNPQTGQEWQTQLSYIIFRTHGGLSDLTNDLRTMSIIIGIAGILLSLILSIIFTDKLRKQIVELSKATELISSGNFNNRIKVKSKDELGKLSEAFNLMLDKLGKNQKAMNEYSDFITLINQNASLSEISNAALTKIISTHNFVIGALYTVDENEVKLISTYGLDSEIKPNISNEFYNRILSTKEPIEINSEEELPVIGTGTVNFRIRNLLIQPIIYNNNIIALLELGSFDSPSDEARSYLTQIQEQLAIGLTNAKAVVQLENFVGELKKLNEEYEKQNIRIKKQNDSLVELHNQLKEKASELEKQKEKAEESTQLKSQFLASMSHELRTPMNSILGLTELILEKADLTGKNKERLEVVLKSGKRLMNLINDILDLSKIEAGKMDIREEDVLLDELLDDISGTITPLSSNKDLDFKIVRQTSTKIMINTDRGKLTQVLINLLGNAVKFTEQGSVSLVVSQTENKMLKFEAKDTGIGIPEDQLPIIFEEFRQVDGSTTRKYSGTGLGLTICKKIVNMLGGEIGVESKEGVGSTFSFTIPVKLVDAKQDAILPEVNLDKLRKNRENPILVIDDDPEIRYTIGQYLISKGYEVIFAENGDEGINKAVEMQPFAITLDVMLPDKDGWSVLKELKESPATKDIPVILISIIGDKKIGYGLGAFEYFVKPISSDKLISAFNKLELLAKKRIKKIIVVDDDELEFEKFKKEFKNDNLTIEYIQDSEFAFSKISEVQPDLIILDLMMPKVDGVTLSYKLKSSVKTKHIPIIISTAKDLSSDEKTSLNNIVEDITVKSKGHPLDVLKIVRDRIKMHEAVPERKEEEIEVTEERVIVKEEIDETDFIGEVLIVDDDPDTLFTITEMVSAANCKTITATNGKECLKVLEERKPDLVLLDIMMPEMDGFQTIKRIRENPALNDLIVYAVTAKAMAGDKEIILKSGFSDYIPKPVNGTFMKSKIEQLFSKLKTT